MRDRASHRTDVLVVGAGLAGLYASLEAAARGARTTLVTKGSLQSSNSFMAQGGIAAAVGPDDDPALHAADTLAVGRGIADPAAVDVLVRDGVQRVFDLERLGVRVGSRRRRPAAARPGGRSQPPPHPARRRRGDGRRHRAHADRAGAGRSANRGRRPRRGDRPPGRRRRLRGRLDPGPRRARRDPRADDAPRHRRRGGPLLADHQPARRNRRRDRDRPPRGRRGQAHGVRAVPSDRGGSRRARVPRLGGRPRRGRPPRLGNRGAVHARRAPRRRAGAARRRDARHPGSPRGGPAPATCRCATSTPSSSVAGSPRSSRDAPGLGSTFAETRSPSPRRPTT